MLWVWCVSEDNRWTNHDGCLIALVVITVSVQSYPPSRPLQTVHKPDTLSLPCVEVCMKKTRGGDSLLEALNWSHPSLQMTGWKKWHQYDHRRTSQGSWRMVHLWWSFSVNLYPHRPCWKVMIDQGNRIAPNFTSVIQQARKMSLLIQSHPSNHDFKDFYYLLVVNLSGKSSFYEWFQANYGRINYPLFFISSPS